MRIFSAKTICGTREARSPYRSFSQAAHRAVQVFTETPDERSSTSS